MGLVPQIPRVEMTMNRELIEDLKNQGVFVTSLQELTNWGRSNSVWPLNFGLACCAIEMIAASMARFDIARFGSEVFRPSPRQADLMIVAGTVTKKMAPQVVRLYNQMPDPKYVIAMGACAISGGPFKQGYNVLKGIDRFIPVDIHIPGCPPRPEALLHGLIKIQEKMRGEKLTGENQARHLKPDQASEFPVPEYGSHDLVPALQSPASGALPPNQPARNAERHHGYAGTTHRTHCQRHTRRQSGTVAQSLPCAQHSLIVAPDCMVVVATFLRDNPQLLLDFASNVTGVDWPEHEVKEKVTTMEVVDGEEKPVESIVTRTIPGFLEVVYHLYSMRLRHGPVILRTRTGNRSDDVSVPSLTPVWRSCEFQEREVFDLYGIIFDNHPDLRRLLMWENFEGHPMRRDYVEPDDYEWEPTPHDSVLGKNLLHQGKEQPTA